MIFSCIIPCSSKDINSEKYKDLIDSINGQDFPQEQVEVLTITDGDSESAKAKGIWQASGKICGMFCADNMITSTKLFLNVYENLILHGHSATYPIRYCYNKKDNSINRYFSLIGGNDPICYYLGKNDRRPHVESLTIESSYPPSYGCNGFFYRSELIQKTDLEHYYPMDNAMEVKGEFSALDCDWVWHRTSDNLITFLIKRYKYARDLYSDRSDRRWKMLDTREDYWRLLGFILSTITIIPTLFLSIRGWWRIRDLAWFWHPLVCIGFLITYGVLVCRNILKSRLLFRHWNVLSLFKDALSPSGPKHLKTTR